MRKIILKIGFLAMGLGLASCHNKEEFCLASLGFLQTPDVVARITADGVTVVDGYKHNEVKEMHIIPSLGDGMHTFELYTYSGDSLLFQSSTLVKTKRGLPESIYYLRYKQFPGEQSMISIHACQKD